MVRERFTRAAPWVLLGLVLVGETLFGGVQPRFRHIFLATVLAAAGAVLVLLPEDRQAERRWFWLLALFPAWLVLQLAPLPAGLQAATNPTRAAWVAKFWPGPAEGPGGEALVGPPPGWFPLSIDPVAGREFLFLVLGACALFLASRAVFRDRPGLRAKLAWGLVLFTAAEALYGLGQWTAGSPKVLWFDKAAYLDCATGTLINRNHFAMLLYLGMGCALSLMQSAPDLRGPWRGERDGRETARRVTLAVAVALQFAGILASKSRAGLAGGLLVLLLGLPIIMRHRRWAQWAALGLVALLIIPVALFVGADLMQRLSALPSEWTGEQSRGEVLRQAPRMLADFPLGTGGGTFEYSFQQYRTPGIRARYDFAHNDYLQILLEAGIPGLLLALAPVVYFGALALTRRRLRGEDEIGTGIPLPLLGAFLAVALHEWVDFGLLIPAHALLVALLAGAVAVPRSSAPAGKRLRQGWAAAALLICLPAALHSALRWDLLPSSLQPLTLPDTVHREATEAFRAWRKAQGDTRPLEEALRREGVAQSHRPFEPIYAVQFALQNLALAEAREKKRQDAEVLREQASRAASRARRLDPHNAHNRKRTMDLSLSLGEMDLVFDDARLVAGDDSMNRDLVDTLLRSGIPGPLIAAQVTGNPLTMRHLLWSLLQEEDWETAGMIVPAGVKPTALLCRCSSQVRMILKTAHQEEGETFLRGCLDLPEVKGDAALAAEIRASLAWDHFGRGKLDLAETTMLQIPPGPTRIWVELDILRALGKWEELQKAALGFVGSPTLRDNPQNEARLRYRLAEAYIRTGQNGQGLAQLEKVTTLDQAHQPAQDALWKLRRGENPFPAASGAKPRTVR